MYIYTSDPFEITCLLFTNKRILKDIIDSFMKEILKSFVLQLN